MLYDGSFLISYHLNLILTVPLLIIQEWSPRRFTYEAMIDILWQIASAVKHLHQLGIMHLDLKPSNVLVSPSRVPELARDGYVRVAKLTDFGCAMRNDISNAQYFITAHFGSTRYRAPDQHLAPAKIDPEKYDVYSFGILSSELLTGQTPFPRHEVTKLGVAVGKNKERPELPPDCPQDLAALIEKCWAHKPKDRPDPSQICDELLKVRARLLKHQFFRAPSRSARSSEALVRVGRSRLTQTHSDLIDLSTKRAKLQEFFKSVSARLPSPSSMSVNR
jgi:serine/threonine protein kinase